jgi:hypothetical protein
MSGIVCAGNGIVGGEQGVLKELSLRTFLQTAGGAPADVGVRLTGPSCHVHRSKTVTIA